MTPAQRRAVRIAVELRKAIGIRAARAHMMVYFDQLTPAAQAGYLVGLAMIDQHIRGLRALLADQLELTANDPPSFVVQASGPLAWGPGGQWEGPPTRGRHHRP